MSESEILSEYFKKTSTDNFFDQISCETSSSYDSMNNEASRRSCAWIPSEQTRKLLIQVATNVNSPVHVEENLRLTKPKRVLHASALQDYMMKYIREDERVPTLTVKDVTLDDRGLRELIQAESYLAAIELTEKMLSVYDNNSGKHTLTSVQLWFTRIALLIKAKFFQEAYEESKPWWNFDTPDLYLQYYPTLYGGRIGTMVPFSFRLLVAELPQYVKSSPDHDNMTITLDRLFSIQATIKKIIANLCNDLSEDGSMIELSEQDRTESKNLWIQRETRLKHSIVNCALYFKQYTLAHQVLTQLLDHPRRPLSRLEKAVLHSSLGRILIQAGDLSNAKHNFHLSIENSVNVSFPSSSNDVEMLRYQQDIDKALLLVAENNIKEARNVFNAILDSLNAARNVVDMTDARLENIFIVVTNNKAVCELYLGNLKQSIALLQSLLKYKQSLNNHLVANLCTFYDVHGVNAKQNKFRLLQIMNENRFFLNNTCLGFLKL